MAQGPSLMPYALRAVMAGLYVFPVEPGKKTPIRIYQDRDPEDAPWTIRWSEVATNDPNKIREWWTYAPMANIGIACKPSGLFVVDCDRAKADNALRDTQWAYLHDLFGPRVDGEIVWDQVVARYGGVGGDPNAALQYAFGTYQVATGSGGRHYYFKWPADVQSSQDSIVRGLLDVRGNGGERGGYVLGPGSVTNSGRYEGRFPDSSAIYDAPAWLVQLCRYREPLAAAVRKAEWFNRPRNLNFGGLADQVRYAIHGNRNQALLWAARAMCADGASQEECEKLLIPAYLENNGDGGERQALQTIRSAYRLQRGKM